MINARGVPLLPYREDVDARDFAPHLLDRHQCITNLKFIWQPPCIGSAEREIIFDIMEVGDVARDEPEFGVAVHQLVPLHGNKILELGFGQNSEGNKRKK